MLIGNDGDNRITGLGGVDTQTGGLGADVFVLGEGATGAALGQRDLITDFTVGTDQLDLEAIDANTQSAGDQAFRWLGTNAFDGQAGGLRATFDAGRNVTVLEGDTNGDNVANFAIELSGDKTLGIGDFTAGSLLLPITRVGTAGSDTLTGGEVNDHLDGGSGADVLIGGKGDDTYVVDDVGDVVTESGGTSYVPPAGFTIKGTADLDGDGELDVVVVNAATNVAQIQLLKNGVVQSTLPVPNFSPWTVIGFKDVDGNGKTDILYQHPPTGQYGVVYLNGTTVLANGAISGTHSPDAIQPLAGGNEGDDLIESSVTYTLPTGVENLTLTGNGNINATGNASNNVLIGNDGDNRITGLGGDDKLIGGTGADTLVGGLGNDTYRFDANFGHDVVEGFVAGANSVDVLEFQSGLFANVNAILAAASTVGSDTLLALDPANTILLKNTSISDLHQDDFRII